MMGHNIKPEWVSLSLVLALATGMILADAFTLPLILWLFIFWPCRPSRLSVSGCFGLGGGASPAGSESL